MQRRTNRREPALRLTGAAGEVRGFRLNWGPIEFVSPGYAAAVELARQYDEAIESARKALELNPDFTSAHRLLSLGYQAKGMFAEAIEENERWNKGAENDTEARIALAQIHAAAGNRAEAMRLLGELNTDNATTGSLPRGNLRRRNRTRWPIDAHEPIVLFAVTAQKESWSHGSR